MSIIVSWEKLFVMAQIRGYSGGFRNLERGVQLLAREARPKIFGLPRPLSVTLAVPTEYLEATLGLERLEISNIGGSRPGQARALPG